MTKHTQGAGMRSAAIALAAAMALNSAPAFAAPPADVLVVAGNIGNWTSLDPAHGDGADVILPSVCTPLVGRTGPDLTQVASGLAESWTVSDDGKTITFALRQGLKFPVTGNPFSAKDVLFNIQRLYVINSGRAADLVQFGFTADNYTQQITAPDDHTIVVTLPAPAAIDTFLYFVMGGLTGYALDSVEILKHQAEADLGKAWLQGTTACIGPFRAGTIRLGELVTFVRNDDFYGDKPQMSQLIFQNIPESGAQRLVLEAGDADIALNLNPTDLDVASKTSGLRVESVLAHSVSFISFNDEHPILGNPLVSEALKYLIDYDALAATVFNGGVIPRQTLVPLGAFGGLNEEEGAPFSLDLDKAKALITEAGYPDGFSATLLVRQNPGLPEVAQHLQQNAASIGIDLKVQSMAGSEITPLYRSRQYEALMTSWSSLYPDADAMASRFAYNPGNSLEANNSSFPTWRAAWSDDWFNETTLKARAEQDPAIREALYRELQLRWMKEAPMAILFQHYKQIAVSDRVTSIPRTPFIADYFNLATKAAN
jgi:peptide/nickel transport system substrate-binding protein